MADFETFEQLSKHPHPVVPEPAVTGAIVMGLALLIFLWNRRRKIFSESACTSKNLTSNPP